MQRQIVLNNTLSWSSFKSRELTCVDEQICFGEENKCVDIKLYDFWKQCFTWPGRTTCLLWGLKGTWIFFFFLEDYDLYLWPIFCLSCCTSRISVLLKRHWRVPIFSFVGIQSKKALWTRLPRYFSVTEGNKTPEYVLGYMLAFLVFFEDFLWLSCNLRWLGGGASFCRECFFFFRFKLCAGGRDGNERHTGLCLLMLGRRILSVRYKYSNENFINFLFSNLAAFSI